MNEGERRSLQVSADDRVELGFLEGVRRRLPGDLATARALADLYTRVGRFQEGLAIDLDLCRKCPEDPMVWYNLACSEALCGHAEAALNALDRAIALGYVDRIWMRRDPDLASLHHLEKFRRLAGMDEIS